MTILLKISQLINTGKHMKKFDKSEYYQKYRKAYKVKLNVDLNQQEIFCSKV